MSNELIGYLIVAVGVAVLAAGVVTFVRERRRAAQFARARGVVVEVLPVRTGNPRYVVSSAADGPQVSRKSRQRVRVQFRSGSGRAVTFTSSLSTQPGRYALGSEVDVRYDPANPRQATLDEPLHHWFATAMLVGFGFFGIAMGGLAVFMAKLFG